ncbi:MAG: hypothetical protein Q7J07_07765 [Pelolinea sp.]|nr:hypothetical protein [Pelolinea sp.]
MPKQKELFYEQQHRIDLQSSQVNDKGEFEILAITAGDGNGWEFSADILKQSLSLWDNAQTFVDHHWFGHSVHDLAGVCFDPEWDETAQGIKLTLRPVGPAAPILSEIGRQMLAEDQPKPDLGFSADLIFTANGKEVKEVLRVFSVDLVVNPARGGEFIRELYQKFNLYSEGANMPKQIPTALEPIQDPLPGVSRVQQQITDDTQAVEQLLNVQGHIQTLNDEADKARAMRIKMGEQFLESALTAAKLPAPVAERLRVQFAGKLFEADELTLAIEDSRKMVSELTGGAVVQGPRVHSMFDTADKLQASVDDLLGAPRDEAAKAFKVAKLSGIRELYLMLTGDYDLHGGFDTERVQFATTVDFTGLVKNALNKIVINTWDQLGMAGYDWWNRVSRVEHFSSLQSITGTLVGTVGTLPTVAEGAEYTELVIGDSPETASFTKYGGYIPLTLELIDRDESRKLAAYPRELAAAGLRKISALVSAIFTASSGIGPTMADTGALFNATAVTTAGGHANLLTTALAAAQWDLVCAAVYNQPMLIKNATGITGTGPAMAINPRFCLVPRALQLAAMKILYPTLENAANIYSENMQRGQPGDVITVPEWTDANNFAAVCDPLIAPAIYIGERFGIMPEIFIAGDNLSPAVFMNDEHRLKVRHFLACWVNDFRPLHKSNVA